jgi:hypothetical protein
MVAASSSTAMDAGLGREDGETFRSCMLTTAEACPRCPQLGLIATAATLRCELERLEGRLSVGEAVDLDQFGRICGHYRRICETLGIERKHRDVTPSLHDYLQRIAEEEQANEEAPQ